jgi:hypothetical protein
MILCNDNGYKQVHDISPVTPNAKFTDYTTLNKDPNYLIITHPDLMEAAEAYKSYRISSGYNAEVFNINELYVQYAYGVKKHP